jgi:hypothetical protein
MQYLKAEQRVFDQIIDKRHVFEVARRPHVEVVDLRFM